MRIDLAAFNNDGSPTMDNPDRKVMPVGKPGYPKSEPVLEGSYVFPKVVDRYGIWFYSTPGAGTVSADR